MQPFHLPRFEHSEYHPAPNDIGTSAEQDELVDKVLNREGPSHSSRDPPFDTRLSEDQVGLKLDEDENDLDLENPGLNSYQTPVMVSDLEGAVATFVPKSMIELAKEAESRREDGLLHLSNPVVSSDPQVTNGTSDTQERVPTPRISSNRAVSNAKAPKARRGNRKPNTLDELDDGVHAGVDEASRKDTVIEGDTFVCKGTKQAQTSLKRKRKVSTPVTPAPSTRTLRPRAPKSAEKIKLEREAEEAYRIATAE